MESRELRIYSLQFVEFVCNDQLSSFVQASINQTVSKLPHVLHKRHESVNKTKYIVDILYFEAIDVLVVIELIVSFLSHHTMLCTKMSILNVFQQ